MKFCLVLIGSASAAIVAVLIAKAMGLESSGMIGGAVGGVCGGLLSVKLMKKGK